MRLDYTLLATLMGHMARGGDSLGTDGVRVALPCSLSACCDPRDQGEAKQDLSSGIVQGGGGGCEMKY